MKTPEEYKDFEPKGNASAKGVWINSEDIANRMMALFRENIACLQGITVLGHPIYSN